MKRTAWLILALAPLTALSVLAQTSNPAPPVATPPPPVVTAVPDTTEPPAEKPAKPAKKAKHKKAAKPAAAKSEKAGKSEKMAKAEKTGQTNEVTVLNPPVAATVKCNVLDVRGQAGFIGEIITYLKKGESVSVLEEIHLAHVRAGEPPHWSQIVMPANTAVWVDGEFIDPETKEVRAKKVNVRGGPGENFSVIARIDKGTPVTAIGKKEGWLEIAAPTNAFAYVASQYLDAMTPAAGGEVAAAPAPTAPAPTPTPPVVVNVPTETAPAAPAPTPPSEPAPAPAPVVTAPPPAVTQPEPGKMEVPRIVTREGFLHRAYNIQAPSGYELHDIKTGVVTEYVQPAHGQKIKTFVGTRVRITGSESLDERWARTPILQVQTVELMP